MSGTPFVVQDAHDQIFGSDDYVWPMRFPEAGAVLERQTTRHLQFASELEDQETRYVMIGCIPLVIAALTFTDAALQVAAAEQAGIELSALPKEAQYLARQFGADELDLPFTAAGLVARRTPSLALLREIRMTAKWNGANAIAGLLYPEATVSSVNGLIKRHVETAGVPVRFRYHWSIFNAPKSGGSAYRIDVSALAESFAEMMADVAELPDAIRSRLHSLLLRGSRYALAKTADDLNRLSSLRSMPDVLWSGSGGHYPTRLIGLEVMRRGGRTRRFAHGLSAGIMYRNQKPFRTSEFAVSSEFTVPTPRFLEFLDELNVMEETPAKFRSSLISGAGDTHLYEAPPTAMTRRPPKLRRVLYAPTKLRGFRQYLSPQLPDSLYLDWRVRLFHLLETLPIDLTFTLHSRERGDKDILVPSNGTAVTDRSFEELLHDADVVLFDYLKSSTVAAAVCTNKPIVYIDLEGLEFESKSLAQLKNRCTVLHASHDDRGRPVIDWEELSTALLEPPKLVDPSFFRDLYCGRP